MKRRLNGTDYFLILLLLCCAVGSVWRVWDLRSGERATDGEYELLAEWKNVDKRTADCLSVGETLYTASGERFGRVSAVTASPAVLTVLVGGEIYQAQPVESGRLDLFVTVQFEGGKRGGVILHAGSTPLAVGESLRLYSERCELSCKIIFCGEQALP